MLDINGVEVRVGDTVRQAARGSDIIPVERRCIHGVVRAIGEAGSGVEGSVQVAGFLAWQSPRNFERVDK